MSNSPISLLWSGLWIITSWVSVIGNLLGMTLIFQPGLSFSPSPILIISGGVIASFPLQKTQTEGFPSSIFGPCSTGRDVLVWEMTIQRWVLTSGTNLAIKLVYSF